jgi:O-antigen ligase
MPPKIALYLCYGFIFWLFRKDMAWRPELGSRILWVPGLWIGIQGSRPVSYWFGSGGDTSGEGNPINTVVFALFIGSAFYILSKRHLRWGTFFSANKAVCLIYGYLLLSAVWSEFPLATFKRVVKDFGCVLMALIFLTQADPAKAVRAIYVRVAYFLFPLSVVFIKFFPDIGRQANRAGDNMFTGITTQKNSLGEMVFVLGLVIIWDLVEIYRGEKRKGRELQMGIRAGLLLMGLWLLRTCDSQTSMLCLILGSLILWGTARLALMRNGKKILISVLSVIFLIAALDKTFNVSEMVIKAMGRNPTLTGRTDIWRLVLDSKTDPILGAGFYTFWDSSKGQAIIDSFMRNVPGWRNRRSRAAHPPVAGFRRARCQRRVRRLTSGQDRARLLVSAHSIQLVGDQLFSARRPVVLFPVGSHSLS